MWSEYKKVVSFIILTCYIFSYYPLAALFFVYFIFIMGDRKGMSPNRRGCREKLGGVKAE